LHGDFALANLVGNDAEQVHRFCMNRIRLKELFVKLLRLREPAGLVLRKSGLECLRAKCPRVLEAASGSFQSGLTTMFVFLAAVTWAGIVATSLVHVVPLDHQGQAVILEDLNGTPCVRLPIDAGHPGAI
jgi:hypothetical protein